MFNECHPCARLLPVPETRVLRDTRDTGAGAQKAFFLPIPPPSLKHSNLDLAETRCSWPPTPVPRVVCAAGSSCLLAARAEQLVHSTVGGEEADAEASQLTCIIFILFCINCGTKGVCSLHLASMCHAFPQGGPQRCISDVLPEVLGDRFYLAMEDPAEVCAVSHSHPSG